MPSIAFRDLNWLAVLVAAVATFMLGALWYTVLFGKLWQRLHGYSQEKLTQMQAKRPPPVYFSILLVGYLVVALVLALLLQGLHAGSAADGALIGFLLWLGPAVAIGVTAWASSDRPFAVYAIDWGYQLVFLPMMGAILGAWR